MRTLRFDRLWAYVVLIAASAFLIGHSLRWNFVTDDAFISFVYSRNWVTHGELVFRIGERVEGYTNFLWTIILALLLKLNILPENSSRALGTAAGIAILWLSAALFRRLRGGTSWSIRDTLPAVLLATNPGFACWSSGGLETQLFSFFVLLGVYFSLSTLDVRARLLAHAYFGLAALTRPEGYLFWALTMSYDFVVGLRSSSLRDMARLHLLPPLAFAALTVPHVLWRHHYYGWWLPNTFYIKASGGRAAWSQGGYYLWAITKQFHLWVIPVLLVAALYIHRRNQSWTDAQRRFLGKLIWISLVFFTYVASVGGDFMGLFRFALPVLPLLFVGAAVATMTIIDAISMKQRIWGCVVLALLLFAHIYHGQTVGLASTKIGSDRGIDTPGYLRWYTHDRAQIGKWFGQFAKPDDFAAVGGAGAQVYYSGIASLDCFGLSDAYIAHQVPATSSRPGHQKYAPLDYQLKFRPTIITSAYYRIGGAPYEPPRQEADDWWKRGYHYVSIEVPGLSSPWYSFLLRNDRAFGPLPAANQPPDQEP